MIVEIKLLVFQKQKTNLTKISFIFFKCNVENRTHDLSTKGARALNESNPPEIIKTLLRDHADNGRCFKIGLEIKRARVPN